MAKKSTGFPFGFDGLSLKGLAREIAQALKPAWSYAPKRTTGSYYETFHTSPRLDALEMLATDAASAKLELFPGKQYKTDPKNADGIDDHPLLGLLENPMPEHPEIDGWVLRYATHIYVELTGEAFWLLERDRRGVPAEAYIIPGLWVIATPTVNSPWYLIQPMGNTSHRPLQVDPNDVIWFKTIDINNPYGRGRGRVENIGDEIESDELASKYAKNFFYNDATPPTLISIPNITQEEAERFQESWIQRFGSFLKARKPAILRGDNIKVQKLTDTPREMDFVESRRFIRNTCNEHWSMPPELMGILENSNRSTIDSADYLWQKNRVSKSLKRFCAALNRQLVPQFKEDIILVPENIIPEDKVTQWAQIREAVAGGIATRNEGRNVLGLPPDEQNGDVYLMPFALMERRVNSKETPIPATPTGTAPTDQTQETPPEESVPEPKKTVRKGWSTQDAYWHLFDVKATSGEEPFKQAVGKYATLKERECRETFKKYVHEGMSYNEAIDKMLGDVYGETADQVLKDRLAPAWVLSMKDGMAIAEETLGRPISFELLNPSFLNWIDTNGLEMAKTVNATTIDSIRSTILEGIGEGEGIQKLSQRISSVQEDLAGYRAERIARTETASSVNFGAYASYKAEGVDTMEWVATRDGRTRDDHLAADGQVASIDEGFNVGGETLMFPGDPSGSAENVINCRCTLIPKVSLE